MRRSSDTPTPEIRAATSQDAGPSAAIVNAWIDATDWHPRVHTPAAVQRHFETTVWTEREVWVAGPKVSGFLAMTPDGVITALYARTPGTGIGTHLMQHAKALRPELSLWTHVANSKAQKFYCRHGFSVIGGTDGDNEEGLPDLQFAWRRS